MGKFIDLTGQTFGYWTVLGKASNLNSSGQTMWICKCQCGTIREVSTISLRNSASKSCGCFHKSIVSKNLVGRKFGKLTVVEDTGQRNQKKGIIWKCKCDCGEYKNVSSAHLRSGSITSCGCASHLHKDISGQKFNHLTVLEPTSKRSGSSVVWKCICDCGNTCEIAASNLQNGHTKSCGCLTSYGESIVHRILEENSIPFETQKQFDDCRFPDTNAMAKFDFFINGRFLLEYDGDYHFRYTNRQWNTEEYFKRTQYRDEYKNTWCKEHHIPLIRIPYQYLHSIGLEDLLIDTSKFRVA